MINSIQLDGKMNHLISIDDPGCGHIILQKKPIVCSIEKERVGYTSSVYLLYTWLTDTVFQWGSNVIFYVQIGYKAGPEGVQKYIFVRVFCKGNALAQ
jgi:hypothetical protein